jgi:hypothetical protein
MSFIKATGMVMLFLGTRNAELYCLFTTIGFLRAFVPLDKTRPNGTIVNEACDNLKIAEKLFVLIAPIYSLFLITDLMRGTIKNLN